VDTVAETRTNGQPPPTIKAGPSYPLFVLLHWQHLAWGVGLRPVPSIHDQIELEFRTRRLERRGIDADRGLSIVASPEWQAFPDPKGTRPLSVAYRGAGDFQENLPSAPPGDIAVRAGMVQGMAYQVA
jgi:hypothetical protein